MLASQVYTLNIYHAWSGIEPRTVACQADVLTSRLLHLSSVDMQTIKMATIDNNDADS